MALYVGDRSPKAINFTIDTGDLDGTTVTSVKVVVRPPGLPAVEWTLSGIVTSVSTVTGYRTLHASGSDLTVPGTYKARAFLYGAGAALLGDTDPVTFDVTTPEVGWPA